jgi:hypothetical protein
MRMASQNRLARLRQLARELERSSRSAARDVLLRDIRERIVLLEIGAYESRAWQKQEWPQAAFPASASTITLEG